MGKNKQKATTTMEPWAASQPILKDVMSKTRSAYKGGRLTVDPYGGRRVAQYSPETMQGIDMLADSANNPLTGASSGALMSLLNMDDTYRDMDMIKEGVVDDVKSNLANTFAGGAVNSGMAGGYATSEMARALAGVEYDQYNNAQNRRLSALGLAPSVSNMGRMDASAMMRAGGMRDQQAQRNIDANMAKWYEKQNAPIDALNRYSGLATGLGGLGSSGTSTQPSDSNIFSAGATGMGTYGALAANPVTAPYALAGGVLSGLGSIF